MKHVFKMIWITIGMLICLVLVSFYTVWTFKLDEFKILIRDYRMNMATQIWNGFRINCY